MSFERRRRPLIPFEPIRTSAFWGRQRKRETPMLRDNVRRMVLIAAVLALAGHWMPRAEAGPIPESTEPIKIALNEWTGQNVTAKLLGKIYETMGYKVEYVTAGAMPQFTAMAEGTLTLQPEVWTNLVGDAYPKALAAGTITELGLLGLN